MFCGVWVKNTPFASFQAPKIVYLEPLKVVALFYERDRCCVVVGGGSLFESRSMCICTMQERILFMVEGGPRKFLFRIGIERLWGCLFGSVKRSGLWGCL